MAASEIQQEFKKFGKIRPDGVAIRTRKDLDVCYAFVEFEDVSGVQNAIKHVCSTNAFTSSENTNYFFDVNPDCFEEALDRFAQFFIKPLMSADATTRKIKVVNSENQKNLLSDAWRMNQLQKHLSVKDHPYHKFATGNRETLDVRPKERRLNTRQELLRFYNENYSANLMHLVIYSIYIKDYTDDK